MKLETDLLGRLRNTQLPLSAGLLPVLEAVVNSIQAVSEAGLASKDGLIDVRILRDNTQLPLERRGPGAVPMEPIVGFEIKDNGVGFNDDNLHSFETLDSTYKIKDQCRGVGRLLWLKAFTSADLTSVFGTASGARKRTFTFSGDGIIGLLDEDAESGMSRGTTVFLKGFQENYRAKAPKTLRAIADDILEHCLWYFIRDGGAPKIVVTDGPERIDLLQLYEEYMLSASSVATLDIKGHRFDLTHIRARVNSENQHTIAWCAANRVVTEQKLEGKIPGLHGKILDERGDFLYHCYVSSPFLDQRVRSERTGFALEDDPDNLFSGIEPTLPELERAVVDSAAAYLQPYLENSRAASRARVEQFTSQKAPRYRPILSRIEENVLFVDPLITDKELELLLHKQLAELESSLISEGHDIMSAAAGENAEAYKERIKDYIAKADDIKTSDLVNYVFHRRTIIDILAASIERDENGNYAREDLIHEMIMPRGSTSNEIHSDRFNLWLLDERLAFHNSLASDKKISSLKFTENSDKHEPDLIALSVYDSPLLVTEGKSGSQAALTVIELKRPMRNDVSGGEEKNPIEQSLMYLETVRSGKVLTEGGRPIPNASDIPGFCYVVCDLTPTMERYCRLASLTKRHDQLGYFGYNPNLKVYIEVISYDGVVKGAKERNRAFFDKLSLPSN